MNQQKEKKQIQKAGGIIVRTDSNGAKEIYLIHRPRHDDWSLPKGHIDEGESHEQAALREIEEETGFRCRVIKKLPDYMYTLPTGEEAIVYMYEVEYIDNAGNKDNEVDEGAWKPISEAIELISYPTLQTYVKQIL